MDKNTAWYWLWSELEALLGPDKVAELREEMRRRSHVDYVRSERKKRLRWVKQLESHREPLSPGLLEVLQRHKRWLERHPPETDEI